MDLKYMTGPITKADAGGLEAIISTPRVDTDGESVDPMGLKNREDYLANPLVYWAHEWAMTHGTAEPIGKATRLDVVDRRIESAAIYAPTPKAQNIRALVAGGFVRKTSIGFDSLEFADVKGVPTHLSWALREWSVVPMPANTDATITGYKSALRWLAEEIADTVDETAVKVDAMRDVITAKLDATDLISALDGLTELTLAPTADGVALVEGKRRIAVLRRRRVASFSRT